MKTLIAAAAMVAAVGAALPAAAQSFAPGPGRFDSRALQFRIERAER